MPTEALLPAEFADLEPFAEDWCIPGEEERCARRLASSMDELQSLYDAVTPRVADAKVYLDQFDLDDLPEPARRLVYLLCSHITVSYAIDVFKQPKVPDSGATYLYTVVEPVL
jgi:hypothetical protein